MLTIQALRNFLQRYSLAFFKARAKQESVPYQRMIRGLIDAYAQHHQPE